MTIEPTPHRLTTPRSLIEAGLAAPERLKELEAVAGRYAIAVTPALAALSGPAIPPTRLRASSCLTPESSSAIRPRATTRSATTR